MRIFWAALYVFMVSDFGLAAEGKSASFEAREERPNIVFMIADDLGWADVEFNGGSVPTPNLNRLCAEGVELRQHYVAPVCSPTRTGFMTGRYWSRFNVTTPVNTRALPFETVTIAKALQGAGYATCLTGKWHLGSKPEWGPNHFGFDHSYGSLAGGVTPWSHSYKKGEFSVTWHRNEELITEEGHVTDLLTDESVRWIGENCGSESEKKKPFFLYVPFTAVHLPIREPDPWMKKVPAGIKGEVSHQYAACILHLDAAVGRIVDAVEKNGEMGNTLIVFTSDNGGSTAENNDTKYPDDGCPEGKLPGNNLPLRGGKGNVHEGGVRVPTIACWSGHLKAGTRFEPPVCIVDWMPTFCALAGVGGDATALKLDGVNIWPALSGESELPERALYLAGVRYRELALRYGDWKLILMPAEQNGGEEQSQLFDLAKDPYEKEDIARKRVETVTKLRRMLNDIRKGDGELAAE